MFCASYEDGAGLQGYVDEALRAFEDDRDEYFIDRERELYGEEAAQRMEQLAQRMATQGAPNGEDIAAKRPLAMLFLAHHGARLLVTAANELTYPHAGDETDSRVEWQTLLELFEHAGIAEELDEAIQLAIAEELFGDLEAKAARCRDLARQVLVDPPDPHVMQYVRRLTRCYIAGFLPECVILCRAVLENAVRDLYSRKGLALPADESGSSTMGAKLRFALERGWLSPVAVRHARNVWARGNKAVHHDIAATTDVGGTIRLTLEVLVEIYGKA